MHRKIVKILAHAPLPAVAFISVEAAADLRQRGGGGRIGHKRNFAQRGRLFHQHLLKAPEILPFPRLRRDLEPFADRSISRNRRIVGTPDLGKPRGRTPDRINIQGCNLSYKPYKAKFSRLFGAINTFK